MEQAVPCRIDQGDLLIEGSSASPSRFPAIFLRDNCSCTRCRHQSGQRLIEIGDIPADVTIVDLQSGAGQVGLTFSDGHRSSFSVAWLANHDLGPAARANRRQPIAYWGREISANPPTGEWRAIRATSS